MSKLIVFPMLVFIMLPITVTAQARQETTYVGEGRYVGEDRTSSDTAILRQRNQEQTDRIRDRDRSEERYDRAERRERDYDYRDRSDEY